MLEIVLDESQRIKGSLSYKDQWLELQKQRQVQIGLEGDVKINFMAVEHISECSSKEYSWSDFCNIFFHYNCWFIEARFYGAKDWYGIKDEF